MRSLSSFFISVTISLLLGPFMMVAAQGPDGPAATERERGIRLYKQGDNKAAIEALNSAVKRDKNDGTAWYYLGLALTLNNEIRNARKAFESATGLQPNFASAHTAFAYTLMLTNHDAQAAREATRALELNDRDGDANYVLGVLRLRDQRTDDAKTFAETAIRLKPGLAVAYLLKSQVYTAIYANDMIAASKVLSINRDPAAINERRERMRLLLKEAADALEKYLTLDPNGDQSRTWRQQLATLKVFAGEQGEIVHPSEITSRARLLSKPEPTYTASARMSGVTGTVVLRAVFTADGSVDHILVLRSLPYGLTEMSIAAARRIKFVPAMKNGKPVSMFMQLEYSFHLF